MSDLFDFILDVDIIGLLPLGKAARPRCFKNLDLKKLPVTWCSNRTAWMNSTLFTDWLHDFDSIIQRQKRKILLLMDNAPVHPPDIKLKNIVIKFFPSNTTALIQPLDQGVIRTFKAHYRRLLVQHIIASTGSANSVDDIVITALDAICWIDLAWKNIKETTIQNTFKQAGFEVPIDRPDSISNEIISIDGDTVAQEKECLDDLAKVLKHVTIGGDIMSAADFIVSSIIIPKNLRNIPLIISFFYSVEYR